MFNNRQANALKGARAGEALLPPEAREELLAPFLPETPDQMNPSLDYSSKPSTRRMQKPKTRRPRKKPIRTAIKHGFHIFLYTAIHFFFSIYLRLRMAYRSIKYRTYAVGLYHHKTPELIRQDLKGVKKLPHHLSVILQLNKEEDRRTSILRLVNEVGEITAWCASAGIPVLSIYEKTGVLKNHLPHTHNAITKTLQRYFRTTTLPKLQLRAPGEPAYSPPATPPDTSIAEEVSQINVLLISEVDGRQTLVDLTKTLAEMAQKGKIATGEITAELVDAELNEGVMGEPDLLMLFGPRVVLDGYPPWQVRLTEIFHLPDHSEMVSYSVFIQGLYNFAGAQMRFGR